MKKITQKQKIAMLEAELALKKMELLVNDEIIKTHLETITELQSELHLMTVRCDTEIYHKDKALKREVTLTEGNHLLVQKNQELYNQVKNIPKWIKWIFS